MEFNLVPIRNPDIGVFVGRFDGEDYEIKPGETMFFPSHISRHLANQMIEMLIIKEIKQNKILDKEAYKETLAKEIIGAEISTARQSSTPTQKETALSHHAAYKRQLAEQELKKRAEKIEAMKLTEEQ